MITYRLLWGATIVSALVVMGPASAEGVKGSDRFICTVQQVTVCAPFAECSAQSPLEANVPDFLVVDVPAKMLSTTAAAERQRASPIAHVDRDQGYLFLQGVENARAYSILIAEETGDMSAVVTTPDVNISGYGVCTPLPVEPVRGGG